MRHPGVDTRTWATVLVHRPPEERPAVAERFTAAGLTPDDVHAVLVDAGDALHAAAADREPGWADAFGGLLAAALLAAEVSALAAHLTMRASAVRGAAVDALLEDHSAVSVAASLGVSRQKVYDIGRPPPERSFLTHAPWRRP